MTKTNDRGILPAEKLTLSVKTLAELTDVSEGAIRAQIKAGNLVPYYVGIKPIIARAEAERWLESLPTEKAS